MVRTGVKRMAFSKLLCFSMAEDRRDWEDEDVPCHSVLLVVAVGCSRYVASDDNDNKGVVGRGIKRVAFNKKVVGEVSLMMNSDIVVVVVCWR